MAKLTEAELKVRICGDAATNQAPAYSLDEIERKFIKPHRKDGARVLYWKDGAGNRHYKLSDADSPKAQDDRLREMYFEQIRTLRLEPSDDVFFGETSRLNNPAECREDHRVM